MEMEMMKVEIFIIANLKVNNLTNYNQFKKNIIKKYLMNDIYLI